MDLHHLRYFVAVSEAGQIGRAAQQLHLAQPALSRRMQDLEHELGVTLLVRHRTGVDLTEAGALLLEHAREVLDRVERTRSAMHAIRPGSTGSLRLGVPPDTSPTVLADIVTRFAETVPGLRLRPLELTTDQQLGELRQGHIDVGTIRHPTRTEDLECGARLRRPLGVVMRHSDAPVGEVALGGLNGAGLVVFQREMAPMFYDQLLATARAHGFVPGRIIHARNPHFTHGLVLAGEGVHLHQRPWHTLAEGLTWRPLKEEPLAWITSTAWSVREPPPERHAVTAAVVSAFESAGWHPE